MKKFIIVLIIVVVGVGVYYFNKNSSPDTTVIPDTSQTEKTEINTEVIKSEEKKPETILGKSVEGRNITAYHYGNGDTEVLFVGGIHGGYSWNTVLVAYKLMDYLEVNPSVIPSNIKVTVIPLMNPDGLYKVTSTEGRFTQADVSTSQTTLVSGRFNANKVDLSRNFDCDWKSVGVWQTKPVSGGNKIFSEPESQIIRDYVKANKLAAAVVWYSAAGGVYASSCNGFVSPQTSMLTKTFADASGYPAYENFDFYETNGDMVNWLAKEKIPAISVLLSNHQDIEWDKNQKGAEAILKLYAK